MSTTYYLVISGYKETEFPDGSLSETEPLEEETTLAFDSKEEFDQAVQNIISLARP